MHINEEDVISTYEIFNNLFDEERCYDITVAEARDVVSKLTKKLYTIDSTNIKDLSNQLALPL